MLTNDENLCAPVTSPVDQWNVILIHKLYTLTMGSMYELMWLYCGISSEINDWQTETLSSDQGLIWVLHFLYTGRNRYESSQIQRCILYCMIMCVCVCVCVCVCACREPCMDRHPTGQFCVLTISADTRGVGTSPIVRPMPINGLYLHFKHIYIQCNILNLPRTVR